MARVKVCTGCGGELAEGEVHPTVKRIVRKNHIFMGRKGGQVVEVEEQYVAHRSTMLATMSMEEYNALLEEKRARDASPAPSGPTSVSVARALFDTVAAGFDAIRARGKKAENAG